VIPHVGTAFSGGAESILPGVAGLDSIRHNHCGGLHGGVSGGNPDNELRLDMEEVAKKAGLNVLINVIINGYREIIGVFVGDFVLAHRQAVEFARKCYGVHVIEEPDIVVSNAYPVDLTLRYATRGVWPFQTAKEGGTKVLIAGAPEGTGYHRLYGNPPTNLLKLIRESVSIKQEERKYDFIMFSPFISSKEASSIIPNCLFFNSWTRLMKEVELKHQKNAKVVVYPYAGISIPKLVS